MDARVRQFCANAQARLQACTDGEDRRKLLLDYVERAIYDHYNVTMIGSVSVQSISGPSKLPFRIAACIFSNFFVFRKQSCAIFSSALPEPEPFGCRIARRSCFEHHQRSCRMPSVSLPTPEFGAGKKEQCPGAILALSGE